MAIMLDACQRFCALRCGHVLSVTMLFICYLTVVCVLLSVSALSSECSHSAKCKAPHCIFILQSLTMHNLRPVFTYPLLCVAAVRSLTWFLYLLVAAPIVGECVLIFFARPLKQPLALVSYPCSIICGDDENACATFESWL